MFVRVNFRQSEGSDEESFVVDMATAKAKDALQQEFLDCIQKALLDPDKMAEFKTYFNYDFITGLTSKSRKSDDYVTIWY